MAESSKTARKWIESLSLRVQQVLFGALTYLILLAICLLATGIPLRQIARLSIVDAIETVE